MRQARAVILCFRHVVCDWFALAANTWYRFRVEFTKLTATSARIDVSLTELDGTGIPVSEVASGSILDTATLCDDCAPKNAGLFWQVTRIGRYLKPGQAN